MLTIALEPGGYRHAEWNEVQRWQSRMIEPRVWIPAALSFLIFVATFALGGLLGVGLKLVAGLTTLAIAFQKGRNNDCLKDLMDLPARIEQYPVKIETVRRGFKNGCDQGLVSFLDDYLVFEGLRTSFSLTRGDIYLRDRFNTQNPTIAWFTIDLPTGNQLRIRPFDRIPGIPTRFARDFRTDLGTFAYHHLAPQNTSVLPPITPLREWIERRVKFGWLIWMSMIVLNFEFGSFVVHGIWVDAFIALLALGGLMHYGRGLVTLARASASVAMTHFLTLRRS